MICIKFVLGYFIIALWMNQANGVPSSDVGSPPVNDPFYNKQASYLEAIDVPGAWKRLTSTTVSRIRATVALIDTGVKPGHPDLVRNLIGGYNAIDGDNDTHDRQGHGTQMAGILGATINNSNGIAGVVDLVNIMPIYEGYPPTQEMEWVAIDYVIRNREAEGIKVILMASSSTSIEPELADKIKEAGEAGIIVVVTAGNDGKDITTDKRFPCALTEQLDAVLCVGATEQSKMKLAGLSNFGSYVDVAAPGIDIMATANRYGNRYTVMQGTSPASAIIAGVAAMLYSLTPGLVPGEVKKIIKDTSKKGLKDQTGKTIRAFGRVDANKAVARLIP